MDRAYWIHGEWEMHTEVVSENVKGKGHIEDIGTGKGIIWQGSGLDWIHLAEDRDEQLL